LQHKNDHEQKVDKLYLILIDHNFDPDFYYMLNNMLNEEEIEFLK
jgi:hypothetical protein